VASLLAASVLVFASGLLVGGRNAAPDGTPVTGSTDEVAIERLATRDDLSRIEERLAAIEREAASTASATEPGTALLAESAVTDTELREEIDRLHRKLRGERARDMEFLLDEISAAEWRTGKWIDETRQAVRYVALRDDSRFSER
jgi:hypothetical protein